MKTDRELLEEAAKAAWINLWWHDSRPVELFERWSGDPNEPPEQDTQDWNPLTDDGDALRLAVKLQLFDVGSFFQYRLEEVRSNPSRPDGEIARRAIVRAAAEIGRSLTKEK